MCRSGPIKVDINSWEAGACALAGHCRRSWRGEGREEAGGEGEGGGCYSRKLGEVREEVVCGAGVYLG